MCQAAGTGCSLGLTAALLNNTAQGDQPSSIGCSAQPGFLPPTTHPHPRIQTAPMQLKQSCPALLLGHFAQSWHFKQVWEVPCPLSKKPVGSALNL